MSGKAAQGRERTFAARMVSSAIKRGAGAISDLLTAFQIAPVIRASVPALLPRTWERNDAATLREPAIKGDAMSLDA